MAQGFTTLIRERLPQQLDGWLDQATNSSVGLLQRFEGLKEDDAAVKASLTRWVSNGLVEGKINQLKLLKRQMYDRESFDLLNQNFIVVEVSE